MIFEISQFSYFANGNVFTGSRETFNYRIAGEDGKLAVSTWYGMLEIGKSEIADRESFPFTPEGLDEAIAWLEQRYAVYAFSNR